MTDVTPAPQPHPPSDLMAIVLAYKNGEADWPTTKAALLAFPYAMRTKAPPMSDPAYGEWYNSDPGTLPNSYEELTGAAYSGQLEWERFVEIDDAMDERARPKTPPAN